MSDSVQPHRQQPTRLLSLGFSRQEHWSGLPFPSPMHESESEVAQSCLTLSNPMDCSLPGSSVHGIFQARVLEWGAIAFSESIYTMPLRRLAGHSAGCSRLHLHPGLVGVKWPKWSNKTTLMLTKETPRNDIWGDAGTLKFGLFRT